MTREFIIEAFRDRVLETLDDTARSILELDHIMSGAKDEDLPRLFKAIDAQVDILIKRYGIEIDNEIEEMAP